MTYDAVISTRVTGKDEKVGVPLDEFIHSESARFEITRRFRRFQVGVTPEIYSSPEVEISGKGVEFEKEALQKQDAQGDEQEGDEQEEDDDEASCWQIPGLQMGVVSVLEKSRHIAMHPVKRLYLPDLPADDMYDCVVTRDHPVIVRPLQAPDQERDPQDEEKLREVMVLCESVLAVCSLAMSHGQIDVEACTDHAVLVLSARGAGNVAAMVAEGVFLYILAGVKNLPEKECSAIWREAPEDAEDSWGFYCRTRHVIPGASLMGKTIGIVGFDMVALELVARLQAFGIGKVFVHMPAEFMAPRETARGTARGSEQDTGQASLLEGGEDPAPNREVRLFRDAQKKFPELRLELVDLDALMIKSDVVSIHCLPTDPGCKKLIDLNQIAQMKSTAIFVNAAGGGGVVDEGSLYAALADEAIAYGCIDSFDSEVANLKETMQRFARLENAMVSYGCINGSSDLATEMGRVIWGALDEVSRGIVPTQAYIVNPTVLRDERFLVKWQEVLKRLPTSIVGQSRVAAELPQREPPGSTNSTPRYGSAKRSTPTAIATPDIDPRFPPIKVVGASRPTPRRAAGGAI